MQMFVDMDGVLTDFNTHYEAVFGIRPDKLTDGVNWSAVRKEPDFYLNIPPMQDFIELWRYIAPHNPIILTGIPSLVPEAENNKRSWVERNINDTVMVICCRSRDKSHYCTPGDILIDDREIYRDLWIDAGGIWITHRSTLQTIDALVDLGI